jgi:MFS family permease
MSVTFFYRYWNHAEVWQLVVGASGWGFGLAVVFAGGFTVAMVEGPAGSTGITNGVPMWSAIGGAVGTALSTALTSAELIPGTPIWVESGWSNIFLAGAVVTLVGAAVSLLIPRGSERASAPTSPQRGRTDRRRRCHKGSWRAVSGGLLFTWSGQWTHCPRTAH